MDENTEVVENSTQNVQTAEPVETRDVLESQFDKLEQQEVVQQTEAQPEQTTQTDTTQQQDTPKHDPWSSWKKEAREVMTKLPPDAQKYILERQEQFHKGLDQYREDANFAKTISKAITPYNDYLKQLNVAPEDAFSNLLKTEKTLRTGSQQEKAELFQRLAHDYGINLEALASVPFDPQVAAYKAQLEWTQSQLAKSNEFRQTQEDSQIRSVLDDFGSQHEFFNEVRETMADLLEKGLANDLNEAYEKAVRLNDDVFAKVQAQQSDNSKTAQLIQANQAAQAAKQAALSLKGSPIGVKNQAVPKTTDEAVRMAFAAHGL